MENRSNADSMPVREATRELLQTWPLPATGAGADKEDRGHVLVVAGSREIPGAALLSVTAALRAGAGKVTLATVESAAMGLAIAIPETRVIGLPETQAGGLSVNGLALLQDSFGQADALLIGPGLVDPPATYELVYAILHATRPIPCVLDALAMGVLRSDVSDTESLAFQRPLVVTPHAGEMAHLTGDSKATVLSRPQKAAMEFAHHVAGVVVLKGSETWVAAPDGRAWRHLADIPGLAVSGSGDVLAGLLAGLLARGATTEQAAVWAVTLHAAAGQTLMKVQGALGYLPRELVDEIPALMTSTCG